MTTAEPEPAASTAPKPGFLLRGLRRYGWRVAGVSLVCIGLAAAAGRWYVGPEVAVYPVVRTALVKTVVASGHVETPYRVEISSRTTAAVREVLVEQGQTVTAGQTLIVLDSLELQAAVVQAEAAAAQAEARMRQMRELTHPAAQEALKQAKATLANAEAAYARANGLAANGFGTLAILDLATKELDVARTQVRTAELQVYTTSEGGSDEVMAQTQLKQAQASLAEAKARLGYATISSPRDGVLISRNVERGAVVAPGKALMVLAPAGAPQLVLQIDEKNIGLLGLGQKALASAEAYPDRRFPATLSYINPSVDISRASVEVKLTVTDPPAYLRQDMTVSVDIEVARRDPATVIPAKTLHDPSGPAPWVMVVRDGRARAQPVRLGLRAGDRVEITEGVAAGDLLVPMSSGVRAGQRVRPVAM